MMPTDTPPPGGSAAGPTSGPAPTTEMTNSPPRRSFFRHGLAAMLAGILATGPVLAVMGFLFDPLLRRRGLAAKASDGNADEPGKEVFVTDLSALPSDGTPVMFPIAMDLIDAWNREANQPAGTIFLRRIGDQVEALNAVCPHAGCLVKYAAVPKEYFCPCHNSSFALSGDRLEEGGVNPSPRALDPLKVTRRVSDGRGGLVDLPDEAPAPAGKRVEIHVRFVNYRTGTPERIAKV